METTATSHEGHIFHRFDDELSRLIALVSEMGELVTDQIRQVGKAIKKQDPERARQVIEREHRVDEIDLEIEQQIHRILAIRQPMARDLRIILSVNRMSSYLERCGDQSRLIADMCLRLNTGESVEPQRKLLAAIPRIAKFVNGMVGLSIKAFEDMDTELAIEVIEMQSDLNEQFDAGIRSMTTYVMEDARRIGLAVDVVLALRSLDRIGSYAESICRQTIFMATGINVRHKTTDKISAELEAAK